MSSHVEDEIQRRIARVRAEAERKRQERAEFAAARTAGLGYRHSARLRNLAGSQQDPTTVGQRPTTDPSRGDMTTVADSPEETPMPAALRPVHCPACRRERPARLAGTVTVNRIRFEVLRCLDTGCGLQWLVRPQGARPVSPVAA